jgi:hypothetical protein
MGKFITNSMNPYWKLTFVASVYWAMFLISVPTINQFDLIVYFTPLTLWVVGRWLILKE